MRLPLSLTSRLRHFGYTLCALSLGLLGLPSFAEQDLSFVRADATCANIVPFRKQWKIYPPSLPDTQKIPMFENTDGSDAEWKRLYLPRHELAQQELKDLDPNHLKGTPTPGSQRAEPGLLINSQPWINFLRPCPNRISSNRQLVPGRKADWVAPHFFELYELPLKEGVQQVVATRFRDRSPYYGGEYSALYSANSCSAEKLFVSQGANQQLEFLHRNGRLVISVKDPNKGLQSFITLAENHNGFSSFVEICRTILTR